MPLSHQHVQPTLRTPVRSNRIRSGVFRPSSRRRRIDPPEHGTIVSLRLRKCTRSTCDEDQARIRRLEEQRHGIGGQDLRARDIGVPRRVPCLPNAHSATDDLDVEVRAAIVDEDVQPAEFGGDMPHGCVDGRVGAQIDLQDAEGADGLREFLLYGFDGSLAFADGPTTDNQLVWM